MKKVIALIMCLVVVLSIAAVAFADTNLAINRTISSTTVYVNANYHNGYAKKNWSSQKWSAPFNGPQANKRIVARVFGNHSGNGDGTGGVVVSATWVYSARSTATHPYKADYLYDPFNVHFGAKLDDRDSGVPVACSGTFHASK